jgi:heme oxygenase
MLEHTESMNIMQQLKDRTREHHNNAEGQEFQRQLAAGELARELYAAYLSQLFLIHELLERRLRESHTALPAIASVVSDNQMQVPFLKQDLGFFGINIAGIRAESATKALLDKIDDAALAHPFALLGFHYVLLGSKHGGKFIAHNLQSKYHLNEGPGAIYFDPYGTNFQQIWKSFASGFNELPLTEADETAVIQAAADTFEAIARLNQELLEHSTDAIKR